MCIIFRMGAAAKKGSKLGKLTGPGTIRIGDVHFQMPQSYPSDHRHVLQPVKEKSLHGEFGRPRKWMLAFGLK